MWGLLLEHLGGGWVVGLHISCECNLSSPFPPICVPALIMYQSEVGSRSLPEIVLPAGSDEPAGIHGDHGVRMVCCFACLLLSVACGCESFLQRLLWLRPQCELMKPLRKGGREGEHVCQQACEHAPTLRACGGFS